ncbi:hypothetical protein [Kutzneria chonburiensis]|uniref:Uncharacterized protein n=1 Tax=Kutzneria chonburiensis TaxID=1483604 RepID=A0ABV6MR47_9PSEU|nr:hypothetical protein [Kutzneria chonburiensis]
MNKLTLPVAALLVAGLACTGGTASAQTPPAKVAASGITASVAADGSYQLHTTQPAAWTFTGGVGHPVTSQSNASGSDAVGPYQEIDFAYTDSVRRTASIRVYQNTPVVLFSATNTTSAANTGTPFPSLAAPALPYHESFQDAAWSPYQFNGSVAHDSPLLTFDAQNHGYLISAADNFAVANLTRSSSNTVAAGIISGVSTLPANFTHRTVLALGDGVNNTYGTWGSALMALGGKHTIANDANATLNKLGYWTDNGATYYYNYDTSKGYAGTLTAVAQDFASRGIPLGYMQLDSWWYPKGSSNSWQGNGTNRGGEYTYRAAPDLFPGGLAAFQKQVNLPLITHARWIDPSSPYHGQYSMSGSVITDPNFWNSTMSYLANSGVVTYEQDWLSADAQPHYNLSDPNAFLGNMAHSAAADNVTLQYCMALPWNNLQSTQYQNLQTTRVSLDRFDRSKWDTFLFDSRMAGALGEWPWTDVFMSTETNNLVLSTLSGGMVGVGDAIGKESVSNLAKTVRGDGVIVKPDVSLVPLDSVYPAVAQNSSAPMVAGTYTDHNGLRDGYVFAYARNNGSQAVGFSPSNVGVAGDAYVYNYFTGTGKIVPAGGTFTDTVNSGSYYVIAPVGQSGIAFLGDAGKFVSLGGKRISQLSDNGTVHATVAFASSEKSVTLHGYAPSAPQVTATDGSAGTVSYNASTHLFTVSVTPGGDHNAVIAVS